MAYAYFRPTAATWAGGAETQQVLIGRHLASKGVTVSFIVGDYGQRDVETEDGITLIKSFTPFKGNRKLRFLPDMLSIGRAMRAADADVYNQRSTSFFTGQLAWFARRLGRAFTFSVGSDYNAYPDCQGNLPAAMAALYRWGIRRADAVVAQTEKQKRLMEEHFEREVVLIRNGVPIPGADAGAGPPAPGLAAAPEFLWVGRFHWMKRAELLVELARRVPEARFALIGGGAGDGSYGRAIKEALRGTPNVRRIDFVPPGEMDAHYRNAFALVNTSSVEGFPNTFLHAWAHGVPVLTLEIDPDDTIARNRIGVVGGTIDGLAAAARRLLADPRARDEMSRRAVVYVKEHHDIRERGEDYRRLFERLAGRGRHGTRG
jgi:glycosyltransferase involved in cell wall biosynthesis